MQSTSCWTRPNTANCGQLRPGIAAKKKIGIDLALKAAKNGQMRPRTIFGWSSKAGSGQNFPWCGQKRTISDQHRGGNFKISLDAAKRRQTPPNAVRQELKMLENPTTSDKTRQDFKRATAKLPGHARLRTFPGMGFGSEISLRRRRFWMPPASMRLSPAMDQCLRRRFQTTPPHMEMPIKLMAIVAGSGAPAGGPGGFGGPPGGGGSKSDGGGGAGPTSGGGMTGGPGGVPPFGRTGNGGIGSPKINARAEPAQSKPATIAPAHHRPNRFRQLESDWAIFFYSASPSPSQVARSAPSPYLRAATS
jgi:hypothetical protein